MIRYVAVKVGRALFVVWAAFTVTFVLLFVFPANPVDLLFDPAEINSIPPEVREQVAHSYGFDRPVVVQYLDRLGHAVRGDFGTSVQSGRAVDAAIFDSLPSTLILATGALLLALLFAFVIAVVATTTRRRWLREAVESLPSASVSVPVFLLGVIFLQVFSFRLGWFPSFGNSGVKSLVLPIVTLAIPVSGPITQLLVRSFASEFRAGYVTTSRAKGAPRGAIVDGVSVTVAPGEFVSLVGESGCGKSTLIQAALGLLPESARIRGGTIAYSGVDVTNWSDKRMTRVRGNYVGFVPQDPGTALNPTKKIGRQVVEAVRFNNPGRGDADRHRDEALDYLRTAGLKDVERLFEQYPHELSGGMKQRALIAIALAGKPKLILADEPTSGLDVTVQRVILDHLSELGRSLGLGVLLVTHDLGVALDRSDRILVMREGEIVEEGAAQELVDRPLRSEYARRLLAAAHGPGRLTPHKWAAATVVPRVAIEAHDLRKHYTVRAGGGVHVVRALDGVSIAVRTGKTHAVVGESGAGKSTLASILAGFVSPDTGVVNVGDDELTGLSHGRLRELRRRLQFVFQNPFTSLDPRFTVSRIVAEPLRAFRYPGGKSAFRARVRELLQAVSLDDEYLDRLPEQLSGGQRQRVAIARALALNPEILVLDEAVSALDVSVQAQILQLLVDLQAEFGLSYVFVTHDLGVVQQIADDVTVMKDGVVVESGPADQVLRSPAHAYTRVLLDAIPGERRYDVPAEQSA